MALTRNLVGTVRLPDGSALASVTLRFQLVDDDAVTPIHAVDQTSNELIISSISATTDVDGEIDVNLWANDRGDRPTRYMVSVDGRLLPPFYGAVAESDNVLTWSDFISAYEAAISSDLNALQTHAADDDLHLPTDATVGQVAVRTLTGWEGGDGVPSPATWGAITGTLSAQTDLQSALDGKATSAQGAKADTAVQPGDNANALGSGAATNGQVPTADGAGNITWATPAGGGGTWGSITGTLSAQVDLQAALDAKSPSSHNHDADYDSAGTAVSLLAAHGAAGDPHPQYLLSGEAEAAGAVAAHEAESDPHSQYTTAAEAAAAAPVQEAPQDGNQYARIDGGWAQVTGGGGVTDHGALTGLSDDDHIQYHTDARGDIRYYPRADVDTALAGKSDDGHNHDAAYDPINSASTAVSNHEASATLKHMTASQAALAYDSGASLPGSPSAGQHFYHTARKILYAYEDAAWIGLQSFGDITLYLDSVNGSSSGGWASGASACDQMANLWNSTNIPQRLGGNVTINLASGHVDTTACTLDARVFLGDYEVTIVGSYSYSATGTLSSNASIATGNTGIVVPSTTLPAEGDLVHFTGAGETLENRVIPCRSNNGSTEWETCSYSNIDMDTGFFSANSNTPLLGEEFKIVSLDSSISAGVGGAIWTVGCANVTISYLKVNLTASIAYGVIGTVKYRACQFVSTAGSYGPGGGSIGETIKFEACSFDSSGHANGGGGWFTLSGQSNHTYDNCVFIGSSLGRSCYGVRTGGIGNITIRGASWIRCTYAIYQTSGASVQSTNTAFGKMFFADVGQAFFSSAGNTISIGAPGPYGTLPASAVDAAYCYFDADCDTDLDLGKLIAGDITETSGNFRTEYDGGSVSGALSIALNGRPQKYTLSGNITSITLTTPAGVEQVETPITFVQGASAYTLADATVTDAYDSFTMPATAGDKLKAVFATYDGGTTTEQHLVGTTA